MTSRGREGRVAHYVLMSGARDVVGEAAEDAAADVLQFLALFYGEGLRVLHGGRAGVEEIVARLCEQTGVRSKVIAAQGVGAKAEGERDQRMAALLISWEQLGHSAEVIILGAGVGGTAHMAEFSAKLGLNVTHIPIAGYGLKTS